MDEASDPVYRYTDKLFKTYTALLEWKKVIGLCDNLGYFDRFKHRPNA